MSNESATRSGTGNLKAPRTTEEARERGRNGGIKSGAARRKKRTMREWAEVLMHMDAPDGSGETNAAAAVAAMFAEARRGNVAAFKAVAELLREYEAPAENIEPVSPFELGLIPLDLVEKGQREHEARQAER